MFPKYGHLINAFDRIPCEIKFLTPPDANIKKSDRVKIINMRTENNALLIFIMRCDAKVIYNKSNPESSSDSSDEEFDLLDKSVI